MQPADPPPGRPQHSAFRPAQRQPGLPGSSLSTAAAAAGGHEHAERPADDIAPAAEQHVATGQAAVPAAAVAAQHSQAQLASSDSEARPAALSLLPVLRGAEAAERLPDLAGLRADLQHVFQAAEQAGIRHDVLHRALQRLDRIITAPDQS